MYFCLIAISFKSTLSTLRIIESLVYHKNAEIFDYLIFALFYTSREEFIKTKYSPRSAATSR